MHKQRGDARTVLHKVLHPDITIHRLDRDAYEVCLEREPLAERSREPLDTGATQNTINDKRAMSDLDLWQLVRHRDGARLNGSQRRFT